MSDRVVTSESIDPAGASGAPSADTELEDLRAALRAANAREQMLRHELQHRVRNMLAVIRAILRRTRESGASNDEFAEHFQGRLDAIARYQSMMPGTGPAGIELEDIVRNELLGAGYSDGPMCTISGPVVQLHDKEVELISLAVHELTTNSVKFGAVAHDGELRVEWSLDGPPAEARLHFRWSESGVPVMATAPRAHGFGRQVIEEALPYQLGAVTSFELKPGGIECSIELRVRNSAVIPSIALDEDMDALPVLPSELE